MSTLFLAILFVLLNILPSARMEFPGLDWEERIPESQGFNTIKLNQAISYLADQCGEQKTDQTVVICNGYMIWKGNDIDNMHNVWSCSKSFTSTVLGLLVDENKCQINTKGKDYISSLQKLYPDVTLGHFATMTSGYNAVGGAQSSSPFLPDEPLYSPGTMFKYHDCAMNQFSSVLTRIAEEPMEEIFKRKIADPIGMDSLHWEWQNWGIIDGLVVNGGAGNKSKGIHISARELARFGHLFLNRGNWDGEQLLSSSWVDMATKAQVDQFLPNYDSSSLNGPGSYGFNWWVNGKNSGGIRKWPSAPPKTYAAKGYNSNVCFVIPEWNMVIVRLGVDGNMADIQWDLFLKMVSESKSKL
jgi:CubicO group peptidase (beta-lactamase class C family)